LPLNRPLKILSASLASAPAHVKTAKRPLQINTQYRASLLVPKTILVDEVSRRLGVRIDPVEQVDAACRPPMAVSAFPKLS